MTNGVKEGRGVSPKLFGVDVDDMLLWLKEYGIGYHNVYVYCGGLGYADDLTLLAPTVKGLWKIVRCML